MSEESRPRAVVFSVDLEPNMDGTLDEIKSVMNWFERTVPRGTVFTTYRIATEMTGLVSELSESYEIGVHVHPQEFGYEHDQLARLPSEQQQTLIVETRQAIADAVECNPEGITSFRAGRHSASEITIGILRDLQFNVDASVNVQYKDYMLPSVRRRSEPFEWDGILELPTSYAKLPIVSRCGLRRLFVGPLTANASTLKSDKWGCSGLRATSDILRTAEVGSFYFHPYDASGYSDPGNAGDKFRRRFERLMAEFQNEAVTASELL